MTDSTYFHKINDAQYSDSVRALVNAWDTKDASLINNILKSSIEPLTRDEEGQAKMMMAFLHYAHSVSYALAVMLNINVSDIIGMDAQADYTVQSMLQDGDI